MTSDEPRHLAPGTRLAHYVVRAPLGAGSMGTVYEAHDTALDRLVALKVVNPDLVESPEAQDRFFQEARAAARVSHDRITHIHYVGIDGGRPFYAMELVPGRTLEDVVGHEGPLPLASALDVLQQAAQGLGAAHEAGFVHRDVKPSNLILRPDGLLKVTDFGLAKSLNADPSSTQIGMLVGTPEFMSPEQCRGQPVDARTDVYALGLTAYWLLVGERPFQAASIGALLDAQMHAPLPSVAARRPDLPGGLDALLARMTSKERDRRPASMREVVALLEALRPRATARAALLARGLALGIDGGVYLVLMGALLWALSRIAPVAPELLLSVLGSVASFSIAVASQYGMEARFGASAGKLLLDLEVLREDGAPPSRRALLSRLLLRLPAVPFLLVPDVLLPSVVWRGVGLLQVAAIVVGLATCFVSQGRTLSDRLTHTQVAHRGPRRRA